MTVAYLILLHTDLGMFQRLFRAVHDPKNVYLVHVDRKAPKALWKSVQSFLCAYDNAVLMSRFRCAWAGFSLVKVQLTGIDYLLNTHQQWDFVINLSGQDYPLRRQEKIGAYLDGMRGRNLVDVVDQRAEWPDSLRRIERIHFEWPRRPVGRVVRTPLRRSIPKFFKPYAGSQWWILSRPFCEYLAASPSVERLVAFYRHTGCPDEGFFQTALMNGPFADTVEPHSKRAIIWTPAGRPQTLSMSDLEFLLESARSSLFARKFNSRVDTAIIDQIDQRLLSNDAW